MGLLDKAIRGAAGERPKGLLSGIKSALRDGPKPSAERIAELQARGFNTDLPLFRGTGVKTIEEEIARNKALHVTDSPYYASSYADGQDSPFNRHSGIVGAEMSREAHKKLQRKATREFQSAVKARNDRSPELDELMRRVQEGQRESWAFKGDAKTNWWYELPASYRAELERRGLPSEFDELMDWWPSEEAMARPGSNLTKEHALSIRDQYRATVEELFAKHQAEQAALEASPDYLRHMDNVNAEHMALAKLNQAYNPRLSATPHVAPMYTSAKNPYPVVSEEGILDLHEDPDRVKRLMRSGYDSAIWTPEADTQNEVLEYFGNLANNVHGGEMVVFRPKEHLTGAFADFEPLLKKYGLPLTGAGVLMLSRILDEQQEVSV